MSCRTNEGAQARSRQLTVFIQNEKGRLSGLCRTLADANINMHDLFIADTSDFGVVRVFCDTPQAAAKVLDEAGFRASVTKVLAVRVPNEPGGLAHLLETIESMGANIEYGYCFSRGEATAIDVLEVCGTIPLKGQTFSKRWLRCRFCREGL